MKEPAGATWRLAQDDRIIGAAGTAGGGWNMFVLLMYGAVLAVPLWAVAVVVKLASVLAPGRRPDWAGDLLRWCAGMAAVAAVIVYAIGLGLVQWNASEAESGAGSAPAAPCRSLPPGTLDQLTGHGPSYLPLGFDCLLSDGRVVAADGPYTLLNVLAAAFVLAAMLSLLAVGFLDEYRARSVTPPSGT
ncbi:hypothetical protein QFZ75_002833 [Streptomyces sp. V3I8]|uniref:hypothetical protein n=1 Tax=Streptomyces sp. V3I8 TaxID=3042279 RepID=UPI0027803BD7|nr:hypothetical protein [Streptomyces sp. V3I8]MDQ1036417.1 hypothetical protein [Streptomyces sp. V3I8]